MRLFIILVLLAGVAHAQTDADILREKAQAIEAAAQAEYRAAITEAEQLRAEADLLEKHANKLTDEAREALQTKVADAQADLAVIKDTDLTARAEAALEQRKAMKARGEDIEVPKDVSAMRAIIEAQESEEPKR